MQTVHDEGTRLHWGAQAGLLVCGLFTTIGLFAPGIVLPQLLREFAGTPNATLLTELVGAVASFTFAVSAPLAGMLIGRTGCKPVILVGLALFALLGVAPAFLDSLWFIVLTRIGVGVALAGIFTGALAAIGQRPDAERARLFGLLSLVGGAAAIVMFPVLGQLGQSGWRSAFFVYLVAVPAIGLAALIPASLGKAPASSGTPLQAMRLAPALVGLLLIAALVGISMFIAPVYSPRYLNSIGVTNPSLLSIPLTCGAVASVLVPAAYGWLYRRFGLKSVMALALFGLAAALALAGLMTELVGFTLALMLNGAMLAIVVPNLSAAAVATSTPERASQAVGLVTGVMFGSQLLFPFVAGAVLSVAGLSGVFLAFAAALALAGLLVMTLWSSGPRQVAAAT